MYFVLVNRYKEYVLFLRLFALIDVSTISKAGILHNAICNASKISCFDFFNSLKEEYHVYNSSITLESELCKKCSLILLRLIINAS